MHIIHNNIIYSLKTHYSFVIPVHVTEWKGNIMCHSERSEESSSHEYWILTVASLPQND
jgi:hypothetical protein